MEGTDTSAQAKKGKRQKHSTRYSIGKIEHNRAKLQTHKAQTI